MEKQKCPEVRFKGYDQNWRLKKLEAIGIFNPYSNLPQEFEYVDLESVVGTELINSRKETIETAPSRAQRLASRGDVFYQAVRPYQKNNYLFDLPYDNYVFSTGYIQIRPTINSYYLLSIVQKNDFVQKVLENCTGTSYPAINTTGLKSIDVFISNEANEQTQIGNFFQNLDQSIALQEKKLTQTQNLKKAMLEKMFPKAGSNQPEVRLKGFSGDWDTINLGSLCYIGDIDHRMPESNTSGIPYLMTGDFFGINGLDFKNAKLISNQDYEQLSKKIKPVMGDILFARYASVGTVRLVVTDVKFLISYSCAILKTSVSSNGEYLFYWFQTSFAQNQIEQEINTGSQRNIGIDSLKKLSVSLPKTSEQKAIANFFKKLDGTLALQQQQFQTLKNLKQAFLEKMFV